MSIFDKIKEVLNGFNNKKEVTKTILDTRPTTKPIRISKVKKDTEEPEKINLQKTKINKVPKNNTNNTKR